MQKNNVNLANTYKKFTKQELELSALSIVVFLLVWELVAREKLINPIFIGQPSLIVVEFMHQFTDKKFLIAATESLSALLKGYSLAVLLGAAIGLLSGVNKRFYALIKPYIFAVQTLPAIVFLPLIIIWFGIDQGAKIIVIFLIAVTPIIINTIEGVKVSNQQLIKMAQSFGASRFFIVKNVIFYEALPFIVAGAKTALGKAFIGLIVAEFYGIGQGLGRLISFYGLTYKIDKFMAVLAFILLISGLLLMGFGYLERRIQKWKKNLN